MYKLIRPLLFLLPPETAHKFTFKALGALKYIPFGTRLLKLFFSYDSPTLHRRVMGIDFPNPVGLAAGLDKNATAYNQLGALGFGFIEVGSVTPCPNREIPNPGVSGLLRTKPLLTEWESTIWV